MWRGWWPLHREGDPRTAWNGRAGKGRNNGEETHLAAQRTRLEHQGWPQVALVASCGSAISF